MPEINFSDYVAICETKARYCRTLDSKDWAGYAERGVHGQITVTNTVSTGIIHMRPCIAALLFRT